MDAQRAPDIEQMDAQEAYHLLDELFSRLRVHFKTPVRASEAEEHRAGMKQI